MLSAVPPPVTASSRDSASVLQRSDGWAWIVAAVLCAAGVAVRLAFLGTQSFWVDEEFSLTQAQFDVAGIYSVSRPEIHPPLYAYLLGAWVRLGSASLLWSRALSAVFGVLGLVVAWAGLRRSGLPTIERALVLATSAVSGYAVVYSQEARSYALLWLAATGLSAACVTYAARGHRLTRRLLVVWVGWGLLASATHLFGALLVLCCGVGMAALGWRHPPNRRILAWTALSLAPQLLWIGKGLLTVRGFAGGTSWIVAPTPSDILDAVSSSLAIGELQMQPDGFVFKSAGLVAVLALVAAVAAVGHRLPARDRAGEIEPRDRDRDATGRAAALMGLVAGLLVGTTYVASQVVHVWTPRNLIVIQPALCWATVLLLLWLPRRTAYRRFVAVLTFASLAAGLAGVANQVRHMYKPDLRGVVREIAAVRSADPTAYVAIAPDLAEDRAGLSRMAISADVSAQELRRRLAGAVFTDSVDYLSLVDVRPGTSLYVYAEGNLPIPEREAEALTTETIAKAGGGRYCRRAPVFGIVVVRCEVPS